MTEVTAALVKVLRERTGAALMDCKRALQATGGDLDAAAEKMRMDGQAKADKKAGRVAAEGTIAVARGASQVVLAEVNCETDFVAKGDEFQSFAQQVAEVALRRQPIDVDALLALEADGQALEQRRRELVARLGENISVRRFERIAAAGGPLGVYLHGGRIGAVVALTAGGADLARDLALHVVASRPQYLDADSVPAAVVAAERKVVEAQSAEAANGKPAEIVARMIDGKLRKYLGQITLLEQPFVKDPEQSVEKLLKTQQACVARFVRLEVGEGIEKKRADFAAEVMAQARASLE
ncbi:MAG: elongation factor Ts [Gammaproteobacteria bacterium]|nr:elongation factor Ts [Gammaproteobacteria bacterium]